VTSGRLRPFLAALLIVGPAMAPGAARAQDPARPALAPPAEGKVQRITLKDGSQLIGKIVSVDSMSVRFESGLGVSTIPIASIVSVSEEAPGTFRDGQYYFPNPNETRLMFSTTGRTLKKGEGYINDFWIFFPSVIGGVTDRLTLGGGMSLFPGVGLDNQLFYVTPKVGVVSGPKFNAAIGALALFLPAEVDDNASAGIVYGVGTWGTADASITGAAGYGYIAGKLANSPSFMVGGEVRAAPRIGLVSENYLLPGGHALVSGGVRFLGRDISVDLALARGIESGGDGFTFPVLGFLWKW
jgi:hypothetical protein